MARRMFSPKIVCSDAFLDMPTSSQALYLQLSMNADDDGFVNPKRIVRSMGASEDDLKVLIAKRFILAFENGVVVVKHWAINNLVRKDFYRETIYTEEKARLTTKPNGAYTENVNKMLTKCSRRLGKDRLGNIPASQDSSKDNKNMNTYDESKHSDSGLPDVNPETGKVDVPTKKKSKTPEYMKAISWFENQTGKKLVNYTKQFRALKEMEEDAIGVKIIQDKVIEMQNGFWKDKDFDFATVRSQIKTI